MPFIFRRQYLVLKEAIVSISPSIQLKNTQKRCTVWAQCEYVLKMVQINLLSRTVWICGWIFVEHISLNIFRVFFFLHFSSNNCSILLAVNWCFGYYLFVGKMFSCMALVHLRMFFFSIFYTQHNIYLQRRLYISKYICKQEYHMFFLTLIFF